MILNRQRAVRVARRPLELFLARVQRALGLAQADVTICFVSDSEIARMNEAFRKKKGPTDVLSFPATPRRALASLPLRRKHSRGRKVKSTAFLGDIAISPATARRNAKKLGRSLPSELRVLILHGVLHLLGYDHETDRGLMDRVEGRLRRRLGLT
jgi:probable rRNA maturation factor